MFILCNGFILQLLSTGLLNALFLKEFPRPRVGSPDCRSDYCHYHRGIHVNKNPDDQKVKAGNGWRKGEMLNYKVMVRKPIWQGMWKTKASRIKCDTQ